MARWLVELVGERTDLKEFPTWFPDGDVHAVEENDKVYIVGPSLDETEDVDQVRELAAQAVEEFSAAIALLWSPLVRPRVGAIYRAHEDGRRDVYVPLDPVSVQIKVRPVSIVTGNAGRHQPTQAQQLLAALRTDRHLHIATLLWADPPRTWPRLYRILEEIEEHLGDKVHKAGLCTEEERRQFTGSANFAEVAGKDSRHAFGVYGSRQPKKTMTHPDAVLFIGRLLMATLRQVPQT